MKLEIKRLDWDRIINDATILSDENKKKLKTQLNKAWDNEVSPKVIEINEILKNGTKLYSCKTYKYELLDHWSTERPDHPGALCMDYSGLLIGIKKDPRPKTKDELLREIVDNYEKYGQIEIEDHIADIKKTLEDG